MNNLGFEAKKITIDELGPQPKVFEKDGNPTLARHWNWGMMFKQGNSKPEYYMRSMTRNTYRSGTLCVLGDSPLKPQKPSPFFDKMAQKINTSEYQKVSDDPIIYEQKSSEPFTEFRYSENCATWKEGDFLDLKVEYFPYCLICHEDSLFGANYLNQQVLYYGTYDGKPMRALGCFDRYYEKSGEIQTLNVDRGRQFNAYSFYSGIRKDGRKEGAFCSIIGENGHGMGLYYIEGEEPVLTDKVYLEADWQQLAYAPNDPTIVYTKGIWHLDDRKTIHVNCMWGSKGHTQEPRYSMEGFSQSYGTWYEGDEYYEHDLYHNLCENHQCTISIANEAGFKVK